MLDDVRERLRGDEVGRRHRARRPAAVEVELDVDRHRRTIRELAESRREPGLGQDRRVDALCQRPDILDDTDRFLRAATQGFGRH